MTTVEQTIAGDGGAGSRVAAGRAAPRRWKKLWQGPLLVAGLVLFGVAVRQFSRAIKPVSFEKQMEGVHGMLEAGKFEKAIEQINVLANYYKETGQLRQLEALAGDTFFYVSKKQGSGAAKSNWEKVGQHYQRAILMGAPATGLMNERWGEAAMALGDWKLGTEKLEAAIHAEGAHEGEKLAEYSRELVEAYLKLDQPAKAEEVTDRVLAWHEASVDDRSWGLCKKIELAMAREAGAGGAVEKAVAAALEAVAQIPERDPAGRVLLWVGRAEYERGQVDSAKEHLEAARKSFVVHHLDDGRAAVLLGKIAQAKGDLKTAEELYQEVVRSHAGTRLWAAARLGRAEILASKGDAGEQMEEDYRFVIQALKQKPEAGSQESEGGDVGPELVSLDQVRASLVAQHQRYAGEDKAQEAMKFIALQEELKEKETAAGAWRLATTREKRGMQLLQEARVAAVRDEKKEAEGRELLGKAAEDYLRHSRMATMEDEVSASSMWKAAQLFDEAGMTGKSIEVYEKFAMNRPRDARVPEALLAMGRLQESAGKLDGAIEQYKRNLEMNPRTPAAYTSTVNLARCYITQGKDKYAEAETTLLKVVQDNGDIAPTANEFRQSLLMLGELYYRWGKWREAILRLEEAVGRYPEDAGISRTEFLLAESYRKSGLEIGEALKTGSFADRRDAMEKARAERLMHAAEIFGLVIGMLDREENGEKHADEALSELEGQMLRTSHMDRAECYFATGDFSTAIRMYDVAATRFSQDVTAADAYVQIVNSYMAMKEPAQASAAAQRGRWVIKRIPEEAFTSSPVKLTRKHYDDLLAVAGK